MKRTTASAVSRVLRRGGFRLHVWNAPNGSVRVQASTSERAQEALDYLIARDYDAGMGRHPYMINVHGKIR